MELKSDADESKKGRKEQRFVNYCLNNFSKSDPNAIHRVRANSHKQPKRTLKSKNPIHMINTFFPAKAKNRTLPLPGIQKKGCHRDSPSPNNIYMQIIDFPIYGRFRPATQLILSLLRSFPFP